MNKCKEIEKALPQKTSLMVGRTEIPKWSQEKYEAWKNEIERWTANNKSSDDTKYCNVLESLKKNDAVSEYAMSQIVERTEGLRMVQSILNVMDKKYLRAIGEKTLE